MSKSVSFVIPFRNRPVDVFELSLISMLNQSLPLDEIILVDISSEEPYRTEMEELCDSYQVNYIPLHFDLSDQAIEVFLWNTCFNHGVRKATSDLVFYSAMDRIYEPNMVDTILKFYNWNLSKGFEGLVCGSVWNLDRTPKKSELDNMDALFEEAKYRGGYGYWGSSKEWIHKVHGLDETIRWYEDIDLAGRMKKDGGIPLWPSRGRALKMIGQISRVLHLSNHPSTRFKFKSDGVVKIAQRGRFNLRNEKSVIRNDEDWGIITQEKIEWAKSHD